MEFHARQIAAPKYWEEFEDLCLDLFRQVWADRTAQKNGRRGQPQHGTDIWGTPAQAPEELHGVQCKGKDAIGLGAQVTETELRTEVEKAKKFTPLLAHWILATTAPKDAKIEALARAITADHQKRGLFTVQVLGWEDLQSLISDHDAVMEKHYPDQAPTRRRIDEHLGQLVGRSDTQKLQLQRVQVSLDILVANLSRDTSESAPVDQEDIAIQAQIDQARDLIREVQPRTALKILERLAETSWDRATPRARFRLLSNRAAALLNLGEMDAASPLFIQANEYAPNDPKAKVNVALVHLLREDATTTRTITTALLSDDPDNADAAGLRVLAAFDEQGVDDPLSLIPAGTRSAGNVLLAAARWHRHRGNAASSLDLLEQAYTVQPEDLEIKAELATALLERMFQDTVATYGRKTTEAQRRDFARALEMLSDVWEKARKNELIERFAVTAANLATALRSVGQLDKAETIVDEALTHVPSDPNLVKQKAQLLWARGRFGELLTTLDRLDSKEPEFRLMRIEALSGLNRYPDALQALLDLPATDDSKLQRAATATYIRLLWLNGKHAEALSAAEQLVTDQPDDPVSYLTLSYVYHRSGDPERARAAAHSGLAHTQADDGLHRLMLADALYALEDWDGAADAVGPIAGIQDDSQPLRLRINALMQADRRQEAAQLISSLPPHVADLPAYQGAAASLSCHIGDYQAARGHLDRYLAQTPSDLRMRLLWLEVVNRLGDEETVARFLDTEMSFDDAKTPELMAFAHLLDRNGYGERALRMGYKVLRDRWTDPQAHLGYTFLVLMGRSIREVIRQPTNIEVGTAFTVEDGPQRTHSYIIEAEFTPDPSRGEIAPHSPLALRAIGRQVGDRIRVNESPLIPEQKLLKIKDKYLHLAHKSLAEFNSMFPEEKGLFGVRFNPQEPSSLIETMRPILKERSSSVREIFQTYRDTQLPIAVIARATHDDPIDTWYGLMQNGVEIDVCLGTQPERTQTLQLLSARPPLVLDPITFWIAGVLDVLDVLEKTFGALGLTQSTINILQHRSDEVDDDALRRRHSVWEHDGQIRYTDYTEDQAKTARDLTEKILQWASKHAVIIPAVPATDLPSNAREIGEFMDRAFIDTIAAASEARRVFLCEDRRLRDVAAEAAQVRGTWLQPALMISTHAGHLDKNRYHNLVVDLALAGHSLTSLDAETLFCAAERNSWRPAGQFSRTLAHLAAQQIDLESMTNVAAAFLQSLWAHSIARKPKEELTATLLNTILAAHPSSAKQIISELSERGKPKQAMSLNARLRACAAFRDFMQRWQKTNPL